jgi:hypothetical protein
MLSWQKLSSLRVSNLWKIYPDFRMHECTEVLNLSFDIPKRWDITVFPLNKTSSQSYEFVYLKSYGYACLKSSSFSQVASRSEWCFHCTLQNFIARFRSLFQFSSKIFVGFSTYVRSAWRSKSSWVMESLGAFKHFRSCDTWKMLWTCFNFTGSSSSNATLLFWLRILKGPIYLGLSFPLIQNLLIPFIGLTFRYTMSPTMGSHVRLFWSA